MRLRFLKKSALLGAAFAMLCSLGATAQADVIFTEDFAGTSGAIDSLDGTFEDTSGEEWEGNGFATDNGVFQVGQLEGSATLSLANNALVADTIYTLSLDVTSNSQEWIGLGFSDAAASGGNNTPGSRFSNENRGRAWFLCRSGEAAVAGQVEIFGGPGTQDGIGDIDTDFTSGTAVTRTLSVVLDTASSGFRADFLIDGVSQSGGFQDLANNTGFDFVGFTWEGPTVNNGTGSPITVDNFSFSDNNAVPEPGSIAVISFVGLIGMIRRRRS